MSEIQRILRDPNLVEAGIARHCRYDPNQLIIEQGREDRSLYLVESGVVRVIGHIELEDSRRIQPGLCDLREGEIFGELSLFDSGPRSASVVAIEACELLVLDAAALADHFDRVPHDGYRVLKWLFSVLGGRLRRADRRVADLFAWGLRAHQIDRHL